MKTYQLHFGSFIHHDNGILELIVDKDIEISEAMVNELFDLIKNIEPKIEMCLVNRKNSYSYSFKANLMLASSNLARYVAVLKHGRLPWPINGLFTPKFYRLGFFDNYEDATSWLLNKNS